MCTCPMSYRRENRAKLSKLSITWLSAPMRKLLGIVMSDTLTVVFIVTDEGKGLSMVIAWEALFLTGVISSIVPISPG